MASVGYNIGYQSIVILSLNFKGKICMLMWILLLQFYAKLLASYFVYELCRVF